MMGSFKAGDVVRLRSGGPKMTVSGFKASGTVICVWFEGSKKEVGLFKEEALKKEEDQ